MRWIKYIIILALAISFSHCSEKQSESVVSLDEMTDWQPSTTKISKINCSDHLAYVPDTSVAFADNVKYIRMNIHFMNSSDWRSNYNKENGEKYAHDLLYYANRSLVYNKKMNLPEGNETAVYDPLYQYVLEENGIFFHADDQLAFYVNEGRRNNYSKEVINKYAFAEDSVLNVFYMIHHPDSIRSKTYSASDSGIALGKSLKMGTIYNPKDKPWKHASLLNHEVGHVLGLSHTWNTNDGCDDTPKHPNCWHSTESGKCKGVVSNNMMDYNSNQHAISPCQIGKMRNYMSRLKTKQRDLIIKTWCHLDTLKNVVIDHEVHFAGSKDIEGNIIVKPKGILRISCRLSMPANSKIIVEPGGQLILDGAKLHNDCGLEWEGIIVQKHGEKTGEVFRNGDVELANTSTSISKA